MIKPKKLEKGGTIGIVSPSSGMWKQSELWRSIEALEDMGYRVKVGNNAYKKRYYLAGTDEERGSDINTFFRDDTVDAIFCSQGGYGAARTLRYVDFDVIRQNPKIFLGYSDVTSLHLAINRLAGVVTFHGPSASSAGTDYFTDYRRDMLIRAVVSGEPVGEVKMADKSEYLVKMNPGVACGSLIGGNLTLVCASLGTPYEIDTKDKILFIEELETEPWVMDHMLTHLYNAGKLHDAAGIVVGECSNCEPFQHNPGFSNQCSLEDLLFEILEPIGKPVLYGLPIGHTKNLATLPEGVMAELNSEKGSLTITETATV